jgi:hypothetical protein
MARPSTVRVWICEECGSYYASSSIGDLSEEWNREKNTQKPTFRRSRCPTPACANKDIQRVPIDIAVPT